MRLPSLLNGLLSLGLLSGLLTGASGCSSDYGLFSISIAFNPNVTLGDRENVEICYLRVADDSGKVLLNAYQIPPVADPNDQDGTLQSGCAGKKTPMRMTSAVSYSTSRTSGSLNFTVYALGTTTGGTPNQVLDQGCQKQSIKVFHGTNDEQPVSIELNVPDDSCPEYKP